MYNIFFEKLKSKSLLLTSLLILFAFFITSCEQKKPEEGVPQKDTSQVKVEEPALIDTAKIDTVASVKEPESVVPDLKGKWIGTFDQRSTTLRITEQDGNSFKGSITINYREVINQQVSGTINEKTREIIMKDLLHSRYAGSYRGKLSEDMKTFSGTFTQNVDKTKFNFNLKKQ